MYVCIYVYPLSNSIVLAPLLLMTLPNETVAYIDLIYRAAQMSAILPLKKESNLLL